MKLCEKQLVNDKIWNSISCLSFIMLNVRTYVRLSKVKVTNSFTCEMKKKYNGINHSVDDHPVYMDHLFVANKEGFFTAKKKKDEMLK